jgi:hypothetical protein
VISHLVPYRALPRVVAALLAPEAYPASRWPYVKVITDFTSEDLTVQEYDVPGVWWRVRLAQLPSLK